jgi:hypothetical protein
MRAACWSWVGAEPCLTDTFVAWENRCDYWKQLRLYRREKRIDRATKTKRGKGGQDQLFACELLEAKIIHIDDEHRDAIYDLVATTTPEKYKQGIHSAYVIHWDDIVDFQ